MYNKLNTKCGGGLGLFNAEVNSINSATFTVLFYYNIDAIRLSKPYNAHMFLPALKYKIVKNKKRNV